MNRGFYRDDEVRHQCEACKNVAYVPMYYELGGWFYWEDDDAFCEACGHELVINEGRDK